MSDTEAALLAEIVARPDDDGVRLVYADFLDEQDALPAREREAARARASFIRLEIELARLMPEKDTAPERWEQPRYYELEPQAEALLERWQGEWFGELTKLARGEWSTDRGFVDHIALPARTFIARGEEFFRLAPTIRNVFIDRLGRHMPALANCPALRHVRELVFFETPLHAKEAEQLAASPYLKNLLALEMPFTDTQIGPRGARALVETGLFSALEKLDLHNHAVYDDGASALLRARHLETLRMLHLSNNGLTDDAAEALADAEWLNRLVHLDLSMNHLTFLGVVQLGRAAHLAGLEHLDLSNNSVGDRGARSLIESARFQRLRDLRMWNCSLTDGGCAELLGPAALPALKSLYLPGNQPGSGTFQALARGVRELSELSLYHCGLGPDRAAELARVETLPRLRRLVLGNNSLGLAGCRSIVEGALVRSLTQLDLRKCQVGDAGAEAIGRTHLPNLLRLDLSDNQIADGGALALAQSPQLGALKSLTLRDNELSEKARAALRERFGENCWL